MIPAPVIAQFRRAGFNPPAPFVTRCFAPLLRVKKKPLILRSGPQAGVSKDAKEKS